MDGTWPFDDAPERPEPNKIIGNPPHEEYEPLVGILGIAASVVGMIGLALLHRTLSLAIVVRSKETELTERVRTSTA